MYSAILLSIVSTTLERKTISKKPVGEAHKQKFQLYVLIGTEMPRGQLLFKLSTFYLWPLFLRQERNKIKFTPKYPKYVTRSTFCCFQIETYYRRACHIENGGNPLSRHFSCLLLFLIWFFNHTQFPALFI